jgi:hypothetical protein
MSFLIRAFLALAFGIFGTIHKRQLTRRKIYAKLNASGNKQHLPLTGAMGKRI